MAALPKSPAQAPIVSAPWANGAPEPVVAPAAQQPPAQTVIATAQTAQTGESDGQTQNSSGDPQSQAGENVDAIQAAKELLFDAQEGLAELNRHKAHFDKAFKAATDQVDACVAALEALQPRETLASVIQEYHASQKRMLAERAKRLDSVRSSGVDFKALLTFKAPIDNAMARKTGRGGVRPVKL